jgi:hypothetical protein
LKLGRTGCPGEASRHFSQFVSNLEGASEEGVMNQKLWKAVGVVVLICGWELSGANIAAKAEPITTFDPPGSTFTFPTGINQAGAITGYYFTSGPFPRGFLRASDGTLTTFDPAGTTATGINQAGAITGSYRDANGLHGFLRAPSGAFTPFDAPGTDTSPTAINAAGAITGFYRDANGMHGFLRAPTVHSV